MYVKAFAMAGVSVRQHRTWASIGNSTGRLRACSTKFSLHTSWTEGVRNKRRWKHLEVQYLRR
jgi:hypothetical protein